MKKTILTLVTISAMLFASCEKEEQIKTETTTESSTSASDSTATTTSSGNTTSNTSNGATTSTTSSTENDSTKTETDTVEINNSTVDTVDISTMKDLIGTWSLQMSSGGIAGEAHTFSLSDVKWTFEQTANFVYIANNFADTRYYSGPMSKTYSYLILKKNSITYLSLSNGIVFEITNLGGKYLTLQEASLFGEISDGYTLQLVK